MFELMLAVCLSGGVCEYRYSPVAYDTEVSCQHQAALIAGTVAGDYPAQPLTFRFLFKEAGQQAGKTPWTEVVLALG